MGVFFSRFFFLVAPTTHVAHEDICNLTSFSSTVLLSFSPFNVLLLSSTSSVNSHLLDVVVRRMKTCTVPDGQSTVYCEHMATDVKYLLNKLTLSLFYR